MSAFLAMALLLVPAASASTLDLEARNLEADGVRLEGSAPVAYATAEAGAVQLLLEAERVSVLEYVETRNFTDAYVDLFHDPEVQIRTHAHEGVRWVGELTDEDSYLLLTAAPGGADMVMRSPAAAMSLPLVEREDSALPPRTGDQSAYRPSVAGLSLVRSGATDAEFRGDFVLRFWTGHLGGPTADGSVVYEAGEFREAQEPAPQNDVVVRKKDVFVTVHVENGTFSLQAPGGAAVRSYLHGAAHLEGDRVTIHDAVGTVSGDAVAGRVRLDGFSLVASPAADGLHLGTSPSGPAPTGFTSALPEPTTAVPLAALALAAVAGLALFLRSRRPTSVQMLLDQMDRKRYRRVVRHAGAVQRRTRSEAVSVMKVVSLLALGRAETALRYLEDLPADLRPGDGMDPFLRAHALNELGETDDARRFLTTALGENPGLAAELAALPRLRALIPDEAPPGAYA